MTKYKVKTGLNQALLDLVDIAPQCRSGGIHVTERTYAADGSVYEQGRFVELIFDLMQGSTSFAALLTQFGLSSVLFANVTVYVRDSSFAWVRLNGVAVRPEIGQDVRWEQFFPRNVTILVKNLETPT
jgi:hypothetical protein